MDRQVYAAHIVTTERQAEARPRQTPSMQEHTQFLPGDRATQILLQQFI